MPQINLAPGTQYIIAAKRRRRMVYVASFVLIAVIFIVWGTVFATEKLYENKLTRIKSETAKVNTEIARLDEQAKRVEAFDGRLKALNTLLQQHISWDPMLKDLERLLPPAINLDNLVLAITDKTMTIKGAAATVDDVAQVLASLTNQEGRATAFDSVNVTNAVLKQDIDPSGQVTASRYVFGAEAALKLPNNDNKQ